MNSRFRTTSAALGIALAMAFGTAAAAPPPDPTADPEMVAAGFLSSHPDLRYRIAGVDAMSKGKAEDAFRYFMRAAYYADKPSQGMVAEMYWAGQGVEQDRALGYAWMDLAAQRGYRPFVIHRERYWDAMDEATRARALELGESVYAKYGDAAAQPRIAGVLRRARREVTGSRTGMAGNLKIYIQGPAGPTQIDGSKFYDPTYWDPEKYQAWHDATWTEPRTGTVIVGEVEKGSRVGEVTPDVDAEEPEVPAEPPLPPIEVDPPAQR